MGMIINTYMVPIKTNPITFFVDFFIFPICQSEFILFFFQSFRNSISAQMCEKLESQNLFSSWKIVISQISVVIRHSRNDKSQILSLQNLRGIVRRAKVWKLANSVVTDSSGYGTEADSSSRIFQP